MFYFIFQNDVIRCVIPVLFVGVITHISSVVLFESYKICNQNSFRPFINKINSISIFTFVWNCRKEVLFINYHLNSEYS
jgi:hypothetical protein